MAKVDLLKFTFASIVRILPGAPLLFSGMQAS